MILILAVLLAALFLGLGRSQHDAPIRVPKYRPKRDHLGRTQRNHHGELIVELYKYE